MSISTRLKSFLEENQIPYSVTTHTTAYTAQGAAATMQISGKELHAYIEINKNYVDGGKFQPDKYQKVSDPQQPIPQPDPIPQPAPEPAPEPAPPTPQSDSNLKDPPRHDTLHV